MGNTCGWRREGGRARHRHAHSAGAGRRASRPASSQGQKVLSMPPPATVRRQGRPALLVRGIQRGLSPVPGTCTTAWATPGTCAQPPAPTVPATGAGHLLGSCTPRHQWPTHTNRAHHRAQRLNASSGPLARPLVHNDLQRPRNCRVSQRPWQPYSLLGPARSAGAGSSARDSPKQRSAWPRPEPACHWLKLRWACH